MRRSAAARTCACGRKNVLLMPIAACGTETIWDVRCVKCGGYAWFDARADAGFRRALAEGKPAGPAEVDRRFAESLPPCGCGGPRRLVREIEKEPCVECGKPLGAGALEEAPAVEEPPLRAPSP